MPQIWIRRACGRQPSLATEPFSSSFPFAPPPRRHSSPLLCPRLSPATPRVVPSSPPSRLCDATPLLSQPTPTPGSTRSTRYASALALSLSRLQSLLPPFACRALSLSSVQCPCPLLPPRSLTPAVPPRAHAATSLASTLYPPRTPTTRIHSPVHTTTFAAGRRLSSVALPRRSHASLKTRRSTSDRAA